MDTARRRERLHIAHQRVPITLLLLTAADVPTLHRQTVADALTPLRRTLPLLVVAVADPGGRWRTAAVADTPEAVPLTDTNHACNEKGRLRAGLFLCSEFSQ